MRFLIFFTVLFLLACTNAEPAPTPAPTNTATPTPINLAPVNTVGPPPTPGPTKPAAAQPPEATAVPTIVPTATPRPTPDPIDYEFPEIRVNPGDQVALIRVARAYAYCNGHYFGREAEARYEFVIGQVESGRRGLRHFELDVRLVCSANFNHPRERLPEPTATLAPIPTPDPREENATKAQRRQHLFDLLNARRKELNMEPLQRSQSSAAQIHADAGRNTCSASLWLLNGQSIYRLYHREGGNQEIAAFHSGHRSCASNPPSHWPSWKEEADAIVKRIEALPDRPLQNPDYRAVAVGIAWTPAQRWHTVIFEADRVRFDPKDYETAAEEPEKLRILQPLISNGTASLVGRITGEKESPDNLIVRIYHAPPPAPLTRSQVHNAPLQAPGNLIAVAVPAQPSAESKEDRPIPFIAKTPGCFSSAQNPENPETQALMAICRGGWTTPYDLPADQRPSVQPDRESAADVVIGSAAGIPLQTRSLVASDLAIVETKEDDTMLLIVSVNIYTLQEFHGPGVYTMEVWGEIEGEPRMLASGSETHQP